MASDFEDFTNSVAGLVKTGADVANTIAGKSGTQAPATPTTSAPAAPSSWTKYLPWVIGAVVLLVVLGVFMRK